MVFLVLMSRMKRLLDECIVEGEIGDSHGEEGAEMKIRVDREEMEQDNSSTTLSEGSDARSMTYSESAYTVKSVTSVKEQTSQLVWQATRREKRDCGLPPQNEEGRPLPSLEVFTQNCRHPPNP